MDTTETRKAARFAVAWLVVRQLTQGDKWQFPAGAGWIIAESTGVSHATVRAMRYAANRLDELTARADAPDASDWPAIAAILRRKWSWQWSPRQWAMLREPYAPPRMPLRSNLAELQERIEQEMKHDDETDHARTDHGLAHAPRVAVA